MKLSTKGRYALKVMLDIAINSEGRLVPLKDISARQHISAKYLEQIVAQLRVAGLLSGARGSRGGYALTREVCEYTLGDILRSTEGYFDTAELYNGAAGEQEPGPDHYFWLSLDRVVNDYVDNITLEELVHFDETVYLEMMPPKRRE